MQRRRNEPRITLDLREQALCRDGVPIAVAPKVFALLRLFVEHPGQLLTKQQILQRVWSDTHVTDASIKDYVKRLRCVLCDDTGAPRYIETVRARGYRYIGDIALVQRAALESAAGAAPAQPVVAVLPFTNLSADRRFDYFADGVTEDIITSLSRYRQLVVIARDSAFRRRVRGRDSVQAGRELQARWVITGSIRRSQRRIRVGAQLVDVGSGRRRWAERYDRPARDTTIVADEIVRAIVATAIGHLEQGDTERALAKRLPELGGYDLVLRARHRLRSWQREGVLEARHLLEAAIGRYPDYASAYVWLGETFYIEALSPWSTDAPAATRRAFELGQQAVALDRLDSSAHLLLSWGYQRAQGSFELADAQIALALELNPNDYYSLCLRSSLALLCGRFHDAIASSRAALQRSPLASDMCLVTLGFAHYFDRQYEDGLQAFSRIAARSAPAQAGIAACYARLGRPAEAAAAAGEFCAGDGCALLAAHEQRWLGYWRGVFPFRDPRWLQELLDGLSCAGLPPRRSARTLRERRLAGRG